MRKSNKLKLQDWMIYDYLFYVGNKQGIKASRYKNDPTRARGEDLVLVTSTLNIITIMELFCPYFLTKIFENEIFMIILGICYVVVVVTYFNYNGRDKRIIKKYDLKVRESKSFFYRLHPIIIVFSSLIVSVGCFIAAMGYNHFK